MIKQKLSIENKRGSIEIVLLVLLVVIITLAALFNFITNSEKVETKISDTRIMESLYLKQDLAEFYVRKAGESAIIATYRENELISKEKFIDNFQTGFMGYEFDEKYLKDLKEIIEEGNFNVFIDEEALYINIMGLELEESFDDISIIYHPKMFLEFNLKKN